MATAANTPGALGTNSVSSFSFASDIYATEPNSPPKMPSSGTRVNWLAAWSTSNVRNCASMSSTKVCRSCHRPFRPIPHNVGRQHYCARPACQKERRAAAQRVRRERSSHQGECMPGMKPDEAGWLLQNPWFVGLISQWIDSTDRQDIEAFCRKLCQRGMGILTSPKMGGIPKMRG